MRRSLLLLAASIAALALALAQRGGGEAPRRDLVGRVVHVVDGDTLRVALGDRVERVRYIGIDTPESKRPDTPVQCFARAAARANARLVGGERVRLVLDVEQRDRFGRLLAYVYRPARQRRARARRLCPHADGSAERALREALRGARRVGAAGRPRLVERVRGRVVASAPVALRMRQSLSELERAFFEEAEADRLRRQRLYRQAAQRSYRRHRERTHKRGSHRFIVLVLVLLATAVLVTVAMFRALYIVMG